MKKKIKCWHFWNNVLHYIILLCEGTQKIHLHGKYYKKKCTLIVWGK